MNHRIHHFYIRVTNLIYNILQFFTYPFTIILLCILVSIVFTSAFYSFSPFLFLLSSYIADDESYEDEVITYGGPGPVVVIYIRVSSSQQVKEGEGIGAQKEEMYKMITKYSPSKVIIKYDKGISGQDFEKRQIKDIEDLVDKGEVHEIWTRWIDRVGRLYIELVRMSPKLADNKIIVRTPDKDYDMTVRKDVSDFLKKAEDAEIFIDVLVQNTSGGRIRRFKKKKWNKPIPFGCRKREDGWLELIVDCKIILFDIFLVFSIVESYSGTVTVINDCYKTNFTVAQIKSILKNPLYRGHPQYSKNHPEIYNEDENLRVVIDELFFKCQDIIKKIGLKYKRRKKSENNGTNYDAVNEYGVEAINPNEIGLVHIPCLPPGVPLLVRNGTRQTKHFTQYGYKCPKCRKTFWEPLVKRYKEIIKKLKEAVKEFNPPKQEKTQNHKEKNKQKTAKKKKKDEKGPISLGEFFGKPPKD